MLISEGKVDTCGKKMCLLTVVSSVEFIGVAVLK
jgi:hypothetical protein